MTPGVRRCSSRASTVRDGARSFERMRARFGSRLLRCIRVCGLHRAPACPESGRGKAGRSVLCRRRRDRKGRLLRSRVLELVRRQRRSHHRFQSGLRVQLWCAGGGGHEPSERALRRRWHFDRFAHGQNGADTDRTERLRAGAIRGGRLRPAPTRRRRAHLHCPSDVRFERKLRLNINVGAQYNAEPAVLYATGGVGVSWNFADQWSIISEVFALVGPGTTNPRFQSGIR